MVADFESIYYEHFHGVYRYVLSLCQNKAIAEDVAQETFYKAMENLDKFDGKGRIFVWLCQIAKNTYYSLYKKQKRLVSESDSDLASQDAPDFEGRYLDSEMSEKLHLLLHQLNEPYKEVFTLRVFGELPFAQIAELFGKTDSWARLIFYRAKNELRKGFDEYIV
jgi:RNA polymerase sigma-70 factor (ECF subfamily)